MLSLSAHQLSRRTVVTILLAIILVAAVVIAGVYAVNGSKIKNNQYQLVKLSTGEIFFGNLKSVKGDYLTLENAYFIQEPGNTDETTILSRKSTVAKAESPMYISSDKVVYWENLAEDSKVARTIANAGDED